MGLTGKCAFANGRCLTLASIDKANCPRHQFLVDQFGVEGAHDVELGVEWRAMAVIVSGVSIIRPSMAVSVGRSRCAIVAAPRGFACQDGVG